MLKNIFKRFMSLTLALVMVLSMLPATALHAHAADGPALSVDGLTLTNSGSATWTGSGTSVTGTVDGKKGSGCGSSDSAESGTLTFTNGLASGKAAYLTFDYNITANNGPVKIGDSTLTGSGSYSVLIEGTLNVNLVITSGTGTGKATTIQLSNIALTEVSSTTVTFAAAENGSYTVDGEAITAETVKEITPPVTYDLVATPAEGYKFQAWFSNASGKYIGYTEAITHTVTGTDIIYPVFIDENTPVFKVDDGIYTDLNAANTAALSSSSKLITLTQNGTLPAGSYEISTGVKLLIPYNAAGTADFDENPGLVNARKEGVYAKPTVYRALTLGEGAVLNCYGQINANAQMYVETNIYTSQVTGPYGAIDLLPGSTLNLESGSILWAYGYVGGEGTVAAKAGSKVYQMMQINDWRGGSATSDLSDKMKGNSFLFSQYYLQNVEANLRVSSGSTMYAVTGLTAGSGILNQAKQVSAPIIGTDAGLFRFDAKRSDDYMTMKYNTATDRMEVALYGQVSTVSIDMKVNLGLGMNFSLNTDEYILPIPANFTIKVKNGSQVSFTERFKLMPGTEIFVEEGASVTVGASGAVYLYDVDDWNSGKYTHQKSSYPLRYVHGRKGAPVARTLKDAVLCVDGTLTSMGPVYSTKYTENGGNAGITGKGLIFLTVPESLVHLKEVHNNETDNIVTITCVPAVANVVGQDGMASMNSGTWYTLDDGQRYQYTMTLDNLALVSGAYEKDGAIYVGNVYGEDTVPVEVTLLDEAKPCVTAENATVTKTEGGYQVSGFIANATVKAAAHTGEEVPAVDATCTETGLTAGVKCSVCGETLIAQETVDALGHTEEIIPAKDPTCTEKGLSEGKKCSVCGDILVAQEEIPALKHTEEVIPGQASTCTEPGLSEGKKCSVCGVITVPQTEIPATGHSYVPAVTAPTCTEKGQTTYTCSACGDTYTGDYVDATGHSHQGKVTVPATCTEKGEMTYTCHCGDTYTEEINANGHNYSIPVDGTAKAPTCTEDGKELDNKCANCDAVETGAVISATGHDVKVTKEGKAPTCTETGLTEEKTCATCGTRIQEQTAIPALGHDYAVTEVVAPTCTDKGYTVYTCTRCDHSKQDNFVNPIAANHSYDTQIVIEPTCTKPGYTADLCSICGGHREIENTQVDALGHNHEEHVTAPTCLAGGYTTYVCTRCDNTYVADHVEALGHKCVETKVSPTCTEQGYSVHNCSRCEYSHIPADSYKSAYGHQYEYAVLSATCTEDGYTVYECMDCGHKYIADESRVEAAGHQYTPAVTKDATCTENGVMTYTCVCGESYTESIESTGHEMAAGVVTAPTCDAEGYTTHSCTKCDYSYQDSKVAALGHSYGEWVITEEPTCTEVGEKQRTCIRCGDAVTEVAEATGHHHEAVVTAPTCTEKGYTTYTCACGDTYTGNEKDALGHTKVIDPAKAPTCKEPGLTEGSHCSVCGEVTVAQEEIEKLPHTFGDWIIVRPPSCKVPGEQSRNCSVCGFVDSESTGTTDHTPTVDQGLAPTYDRTGLTEGSHCITCETVLVERQEIPMLEIDWNAFIDGLEFLEAYAKEYAKNNPGKDATKLMFNYIRTGISRYTEDDWITMAGPEETVFVNEARAYDNIYGGIAHALRTIEYKKLTLPSGDVMEFDHMFGALDVSGRNSYAQNYNDFGSWAGDLCDLLRYVVEMKVTPTGDIEQDVAAVKEYFGKNSDVAELGAFSYADVDADLDAFYVVNEIASGRTSVYDIIKGYYTESGPTEESRAAYFLNNRFPGKMTQEEIREAIYTTYKNSILIQLLESGREIQNQDELRRASCYVFADYLYEKSQGLLVEPDLPGEGDDEETEAPAYTVFSSVSSTLAPGITQTINHARNAQQKQIVYFMATVDVARDDVSIYANYANNDPSTWAMAKVSDQMAAAQKKYGDPESETYIPNYNVILGTNGSFYNMNNGQPMGMLIMDGKVWQENNGAFFAMLDDGTPVIGDNSDYAVYKDRIVEGISGGAIIAKNGEVLYGPSTGDKVPRTAIGITADGKVIMMVIDGRQEPYSIGAGYHEVAQIMVDAGCEIVLNLDGGGSSTFVAKQEGADVPTVTNQPSDRIERYVSSSLMVVSTAETSKEFHHAIVATEADYLTVGSSQEITLTGVGAAGNQADIPDGAYLRVTDESKASIEGNIVTAKAVGAVNVQLVSDGVVVGEKTITIIRRPTGLRFEESALNAIYGVPEKLPLQATYLDKLVTINAADVIWEMSSPAGTIDGFSFIGNEASGVRNVTVTAKINGDISISASMSLRLFAEDESIFDFDNATAGNESLAWNRVVSNTMTIDGKNYYATAEDAAIEAEYTFAMDMKAIKAPVRLQPLMDYLAGFQGATGETPWDYMLSLGARVSSLTNVTIRAVMPKGVEVDYSGLNFVNDFMTLDTITYDENTRTLTMVCNWIRQTDGIDPATANSQGILSGMKLKITDQTKSVTDLTITGDVTYDIYLDTSQLHTFAQDKVNQQTYGIYPYVNPDDPEDAGGHFQDTYITFEDAFRVHSQKLNGWTMIGADGFHYYYKDNEMLTGIQYLPDMEGFGEYYYYNLGEDGASQGRYTGLFLDQTVNAYRYAIHGTLQSGWQQINGNWHFFNHNTKNAITGTRSVVTGVPMYFDETGMTKGAWHKTEAGTRYYYGPGFYTPRNPEMKAFQEIDGKTYNFDGGGYVTIGIHALKEGYSNYRLVYEFAEDGSLVKQITQQGGIMCVGGLYYIDETGKVPLGGGLAKCEDYYYLLANSGKIVTNKEFTFSNSNNAGYGITGLYSCGADGKMYPFTGIKTINGIKYYYRNGTLARNAGLVEFDGDYYLVASGAKIMTNYTVTFTQSNNNGLNVLGTKTFGADGKMDRFTGIREDGGTFYYLVDGSVQKNAGLIQFDGDYYLIAASGAVVTNKTITFTASNNNGLGILGSKTFGADGKMDLFTGIREKDGTKYYWVNGEIKKNAGLILLDDAYYLIAASGAVVTNKTINFTESNNNGLGIFGTKTFGADGKMDFFTGIREKDGADYYWFEGEIKKNAGLVKVGGDYYLTAYSGKIITNKTITFTAANNNGLGILGTKTFGADGKMVK